MYISEIKARQPQAMIKLAMNSKSSSLNNLQQPIAMNLNIKDLENQITTTNKRNIGKSKFTVLKTSRLSKQSSSTNVGLAKKRENRRPNTVKKSNIPITSATKAMPISKVVLTDNSSSIYKRTGKRRSQPPTKEKLKTDLVNDNKNEICEIAVQTNESEILDHMLIVGDFNVISPSKSVIDEIDKLRRETTTKNLLAKVTARKFEEHSLREEHHLDDLSEFLDKSFITRKPAKQRKNILEEDKKLIEYMDDLLKRENSKTESITDIKSRIKHKEQELLSLFDRLQK